MEPTEGRPCHHLVGEPSCSKNASWLTVSVGIQGLMTYIWIKLGSDITERTTNIAWDPLPYTQFPEKCCP